MEQVPNLLSALDAGDPCAAGELLPLVYDELRRLAAARLANEKPGQTLDATALVHEAYLRLAGPSGDRSAEASFRDRAHFFAAAAETMRRVLVDRARSKLTLKRGGDGRRVEVPLEEFPLPNPLPPLELLAIHEALDLLARKAPRQAELVKLRYFLGCTLREAAEVLGIAPATAEEDWTFARAWLRKQLGPRASGGAEF